MVNALYVMFGAVIGALGRYLLSGWVSTKVGTPFPWGTLVVNLVGCLIIGVAWGLGERMLWASSIRAFLFIGILGSFTTFSSFGLEAMQLIRGGQWGAAAAYAAGSNIGGLFLVWMGLLVGRR